MFKSAIVIFFIIHHHCAPLWQFLQIPSTNFVRLPSYETAVSIDRFMYVTMQLFSQETARQTGRKEGRMEASRRGGGRILYCKFGGYFLMKTSLPNTWRPTSCLRWRGFGKTAFWVYNTTADANSGGESSAPVTFEKPFYFGRSCSKNFHWRRMSICDSVCIAEPHAEGLLSRPYEL